MALSIRDVCDLLTRYGWAYKQLDDLTLLTNFKGRKTSNIFTVGVRIDGDWLTLTIVIELPRPTVERKVNIYCRLLELNAQIEIVRFALNSASEIILTTDLFGGKKLYYENFATAMDALSFYADDTYPILCKIIIGEE